VKLQLPWRPPRFVAKKQGEENYGTKLQTDPVAGSFVLKTSATSLIPQYLTGPEVLNGGELRSRMVASRCRNSIPVMALDYIFLPCTKIN
jgi:hypothetical protein